MSYETRAHVLKGAVRKLLHSYGASLGMFLLLMLAALYVFTGRPSGAPDFPRSPSEFMQAAKAERRLGELSERLAAEPDDMKALAEAGRLKYQLGPDHYVEAIADLERARSLGLADARTFYYLGNMYQAVGLYDFAAQEYRKFLNNYPDDAEARMLLAKLSYGAGDYAGAVREYETLAKASPSDPVLLENLALSRWKNKQDYSAALSGMRALGPQGAFLADYAEGRIKYDQKDYPGAAQLLGRAAAAADGAGAFADEANLFWTAADSAYRNKDAEAAYGLVQRLLKVSPDHAEGRSLLARLEKARAAAAKAAAKAASGRKK